MADSNVSYVQEIPELQSLLGGGDYAGLRTTLPIFISNLLGMPREYPYVLNLRPDRDAYQSYYDRQVSKQLSPILGDVKQRNYDATEENLTMVAAKLSKTFGFEFQEEQIDIVRNLAHLTAKYGQGILQGVKKVLAADGITDDDKVGKIIEGLTTQLDSVFDALYGPVGDRLPFYGALKDSIRDTVAVDEQAALLQNVVQRLYPNDADLHQTYGMTARKVGQMYSAMTSRGLSPLNMNSEIAQRLIRENIQKEVSPAEKQFMLKNLAKKRQQKIYRATDSGYAIDTLVRKKNEESAAFGKDAISSQVVGEYIQQVYNDKYISDEIYKLGLKDKSNKYILEKGQTLADRAKAFKTPESRDKYLQGVATSIESQITELTKEPQKNAKQIAQLQQLRNQVISLAEADKNYVASGGITTIDELGNTKTLYGTELITQLNIEKKFNLQKELMEQHMSPAEANDMAYAIGLKDRIEAIDGIKDAYQLVTDEEYKQKILENKDLSPEAKESILAFTKKQDILGGATWADIAKDAENRIKDITEKQAAQNYEEVRAQYIDVLSRGNMQEILEFEKDEKNRDVVTQLKANEMGKYGSDTIKDWAAAYSSMQKAIERTGGTINGQKIQFFPESANSAVIDVMKLITQNDLSNMSGDEINDLFTTIGTGMERANINTDQTVHLSGLAAEEAVKAGGDRIVAGKTGTQLGLAAAALARQRGYGNADRIASMVAQATGRASKSLITQYTGAILYHANDETIQGMRNTRAKQIVEKIKNRENLTQDDLSYLQERGQEIMADMGMTAEQQRTGMLASWTGKNAEYALAQGTAFLLGNQNSDMLIATRDAIGTNLTAAGLNKSVARNRTITQAIVDTMTENISYIRDNKMEEFKNALLTRLDEKLKNNEITQEQYNQIKNADAGDIFQAVNRGKDIVGKFTGNWQEGLETIGLSNNVLDEKTRETIEAKAKELFPTIGSENMYSNMIEALRQKDSNLGSLLTTFLTNGARLTKEQIAENGYGVAIMSLLRPESHIDEFDYTSTSAKKATNALQKLAFADPEHFNDTARLIKKTNDIINARGFGNLENALKIIQDPEKVKKLIEEDSTYKEDIETLQQMGQKLESAKLNADTFTTMSSEIEARASKTRHELEQTPNLDDKTPLTSSKRDPNALPTPATTTTKPADSSTKTSEKISAATTTTNAQSEQVSTTTVAGTAPQASTSQTGTSENPNENVATNNIKGITELLAQVVDSGSLKVRVTNTVTTVEGNTVNTSKPSTAPIG